MVDLECPSRRVTARWFCVAMVALVTQSLAQPVTVSPRALVSFPSTVDGPNLESTGVPLACASGSLMVVVVSAGADPMNPKLQLGNRSIPVKVIGHDPVSRLEFISVEGVTLKAPEWADEVGASATASLQSLETGGPVMCRTTGWVKQVGGKVLPLALLQVSFSRSLPPPGTPLVDDSGRVVGIFFQSAAGENTGYAIPAEAVHRVRQDICNGGHLVRGWLGLALRADSRIPEISRVLPGSPALAAGIKPNDVLISIGDREVTDYADAANAFFYLIPRQPVKVRLLRKAEPLEFTVTPVSPQG